MPVPVCIHTQHKYIYSCEQCIPLEKTKTKLRNHGETYMIQICMPKLCDLKQLRLYEKYKGNSEHQNVSQIWCVKLLVTNSVSIWRPRYHETGLRTEGVYCANSTTIENNSWLAANIPKFKPNKPQLPASLVELTQIY